MDTRYVLSALYLILLTFSVAAKPSPFRKLYFPILAAIYIYVLVETPSGPPVEIYHLGLGMGVLTTYALDLIVLSEPQISLRHRGQKQPAYEMTIGNRLRWAMGLVFNYRGIGWTNEVPKIPMPSKLSRWPFVRSQLIWFFIYAFLNDIVLYQRHYNPAYRVGGESIANRGIIMQIWNVMLFWFMVMTDMSRSNALVSAITVALGIYEPRDWRPLFGNWLATDSVRTFWGQTWHQNLRRMLTPHGKYFAQRIMHLPQGSIVSSYTQLYIAFFTSGIYHASGDWALKRDVTSAQQVMLFFVFQAVVITIEDLIIAVWKKLGIRNIPLVPQLYVCLWMTASGPLWIDAMIQTGMYEKEPMLPIIDVVKKVYLYFFNQNTGQS